MNPNDLATKYHLLIVLLSVYTQTTTIGLYHTLHANVQHFPIFFQQFPLFLLY